MIRVTVWNEFYHEKNDPRTAAVYPDGLHMAIKRMLECEDVTVRTATLDDPECGLTEEVLADTDVLVWWGHVRHHLVPDEVAKRVQMHVLSGMGLIVLHSGHASKIFRKVCGTPTGFLRWREAGESEVVWTVEPSHPIAKGLGPNFVIPHEEMYGERFNIPAPDELIFLGWFEGGEVFRSGCTWRRGRGKVFYFQPGHETFPIYHQAEIQQVIKNAVLWAAPQDEIKPGTEEVSFIPAPPVMALRDTGFQAVEGLHDKAE